MGSTTTPTWPYNDNPHEGDEVLTERGHALRVTYVDDVLVYAYNVTADSHEKYQR